MKLTRFYVYVYIFQNKIMENFLFRLRLLNENLSLLLTNFIIKLVCVCVWVVWAMYCYTSVLFIFGDKKQNKHKFKTTLWNFLIILRLEFNFIYIIRWVRIRCHLLPGKRRTQTRFISFNLVYSSNYFYSFPSLVCLVYETFKWCPFSAFWRNSLYDPTAAITTVTPTTEGWVYCNNTSSLTNSTLSLFTYGLPIVLRAHNQYRKDFLSENIVNSSSKMDE